MRRATFIVILSVLGPVAALAGDRPPNIVLIMADDLGYGEPGCYGQQKIKTPHIDRLAREGMRFVNYYAGSPVCAPSRCVLLTGLHGGHAYIRDNREIPADVAPEGQPPLADSQITIAELLKQQGYATACVGKWGLGYPGSEGDPLRQGFDHFFGYNCQRQAHNFYPEHLWRDSEKVVLEGNTRGLTGRHYAPDLINEAALQFIRANRDRPFFLYYAEILPHLALQVPDDSLLQYSGQWDETPYDGRGESYLPHPTPRAAYAAMVTRLDLYVGRIMSLLDELGLSNNTLVLFTSDNGPTHLNRQVDVAFFDSAGGLRGLKGSVYEGGLRVPMIARWTGRIAPGATSDHLAAHYDVLATLAQVAASAPAVHTDGISFLPVLLGKRSEQQQHEFMFWDFPGYGGQIAVRLGDWKAVRQKVRARPQSAWELYNLATDPSEQHDLAGQHPQVIAEVDAIVARERVEPQMESFRFGHYEAQ
jgi:arylsulfatase A